jgi:hypothetical protein
VRWQAQRGSPFIGKSREASEPAGCLLWAAAAGGNRSGHFEFNEVVAAADAQACTLDAAAGGCMCTRAWARRAGSTRAGK